MSKFWEKVNRKIDFILYKRTIFDKDYAHTHNVFDYNNVIQRRPSAHIENCPANVMYGMGHALRTYSGYKGKVYVSTEHAMPSLRTNNTTEYKDFDGPMVFLSSKERRSVVASLTDKLCIPFGPNFLPYVQGIYTDFAIENMKAAFGKTIVVFPQHNNDASAYEGFLESTKEEIEYIKGLQRDYGYQTVIACLYYVDAERGMAPLYEAEGWHVVSAGHNTNYDFGQYLRSIMDLADLVITQGVTGVPYATYCNKPVIYYKAQEKLVFDDGHSIPEWEWVIPIRKELEEKFSAYHDTISDEQREYANWRWGLEQIHSPENMKLLLEFARDIRKNYKSDKAVLKLASKPKYAPIKSVIEDAVRARKEGK